MNESDLIEQIYSTVADSGRWPEVIVRIADYLGAVGGMVLSMSPEGRVRAVYGRLSEERAKIYEQHYVWNPWALVMRDVPTEKVVVANDHLPPGAIFKTAHYADVLAPQGIANALQTKHKALLRGGGYGGFGFYLPSGGSDHTEHLAARLQRLVPHLGRALDVTMEMGRVAGGPQQLAAVLNIMPNAALLLDARGHIIHANLAAESLLGAGDGLSFDRDGRLQLAAVLPTESGALTRALALALDVAAGASIALAEPVRITRPSGAAPLVVIPIPLPPPAFALWELSDTGRVLVLIVDPSAQSGSAASILRKAFGLTATEARVAALVGSGLGGPQTARALGIAPATVKTHLARCFEKIGIRSQVQLAQIIASLPVDSQPNGTG